MLTTPMTSEGVNCRADPPWGRKREGRHRRGVVDTWAEKTPSGKKSREHVHSGRARRDRGMSRQPLPAGAPWLEKCPDQGDEEGARMARAASIAMWYRPKGALNPTP